MFSVYKAPPSPEGSQGRRHEWGRCGEARREKEAEEEEVIRGASGFSEA